MPLPDAPPAIELPHVAAEFLVLAGRDPDTGSLVSRPRCAITAAGEITVCASDPRRNRLEALPDALPEGLPKAEMRISDSIAADLHNESAPVSGWPSNRMMVGVKIGF